MTQERREEQGSPPGPQHRGRGAVLGVQRAPRAMEVPFDAFKRNPDGSWISVKACRVYNPAGGELIISPGMVFRKGKSVRFMGFDLAEYLEEHPEDAVVKKDAAAKKEAAVK